MPKIIVPFTYMEGYLPTPRCRKLRYKQTDGEHEATIREIESQDFPVAVRFEEFVMHQKKPSGRCWVDLHWYEGRLWKVSRYCHIHANKDWDELTPVDALSWYLRPSTWQVTATPSKERCIECIDNMAKEWLFCDGKLYVPCGEPMYYICTFGLGHNHAGIGTSLGVECQYNHNLPSKWYFNAFERDKAIAAAKEVAYRRGDTNSIAYIEDAEHIEVLMPECIRQNPQSWDKPGDSWLNQLEEITERAESSFSAGLMALAMAGKA